MTDQSIDRATQICQWLAGTDIEFFELSGPDTHIRKKRNGGGSFTAQPVPEVTGMDADSAADIVRSGSVGVLLHAHPLRTAPLVQAGDRVAAGQALAVLRIGAVLLAVPAPRDGVVARILVADGTTVGYGEPLVELE
jgi:acetyl-CoA carboxylase biotin carboxyl carrier protein